MNINGIFCVVGGDLRQFQVAKALSQSGYKVRIFGFDRYTADFGAIKDFDDIEAALNGVSYVILPLPYSSDGINLNAPYMKNPIKLSDIYKFISPEMLVLGGKFSSHELNKRRVKTIDYFEREELQVLNAVPTAEGAIQIAMQERAFTIHGSKCLVVGFGRIGKILANLLKGLNAEVYVSARKHEDIAWIKNFGYKAVMTDKISEIINIFDIVFNTVPAMVIGKNEFDEAKKETLFIDLASKPGGAEHKKGYYSKTA